MFDAHGTARAVALTWLAEESARAAVRRQLAREHPPRPRRPPPDSTAEELRLALRELPAAVWVPAVLGVDVPERGPLLCPFHDERTPSCHVYGPRVHCFGCGRTADIFDGAGHAWGIDPRGPGFPELRERLAAHVLRVAA